jgi:hypothetical protein
MFIHPSIPLVSVTVVVSTTCVDMIFIQAMSRTCMAFEQHRGYYNTELIGIIQEYRVAFISRLLLLFIYIYLTDSRVIHHKYAVDKYCIFILV